jgi:HEPN domain-containing protein
MSQKIIDNWLSLAEYDLTTAQDMLKAKRYLYVAFMCQQSIEKVLKACYVKHHAATPPYTHNLLRLIKELNFKGEMGDEMMGAIEELNSYYIESRYTEDIEELTRQFTEAKAKSILESTEEIFKWIKARL